MLLPVSYATISAMALFALSMSITPGPLNIITLSTSIKHGRQKALPFITGSTLGFVLLLAVIETGLYQFIQHTWVMNTLTVAGSLFIAYMGMLLIKSNGETHNNTEQKIPSFRMGILLQWLNAKAWIAALAGTAMFASQNSIGALVIFLLVYFVVCYLSMYAWAFIGDKIAHWVDDSRNIKRLNTTMGVSLILLVAYMIASHFLH